MDVEVATRKHDYFHLFEPIQTNQSRFLREFEDENRELLGQGGFGSVYKCRSKIDGKYYAVKIIKLEYKDVKELSKLFSSVMREVDSLSSCESLHVVKLYDAWFEASASVLETFNIPTQTAGSGTDHSTFASHTAGSLVQSTTDEDVNNIYKEYQSHYPMLAFDGVNDIVSISRGSSIWTDHTNSTVYSSSQESDIESSDSMYSNYTDSQPSRPSWSKRAADMSGPSENSSTESHDISLYCSDLYEKDNKKLNIAKHDPELGTDTDLNDALIVSSPVTEFVTHKLLTGTKNTIYLFMQMQYCDASDLSNRLIMENSLAQQMYHSKEFYGKRLDYFEQIVRGVSHLHDKCLMHRDLKPSNIFIDGDGVLMIGDFGLAKVVKKKDHPHLSLNMQLVSVNKIEEDSDLTPKVGTPLYASPEQKNGLEYNEKTDVFSLGIILFQLLYPYTSESDRKRTIFDLRSGIFPNDMIDLYPKEMQLVKRCMDENPQNRPSADELLDAIAVFKQVLEQSNE